MAGIIAPSVDANYYTLTDTALDAGKGLIGVTMKTEEALNELIKFVETKTTQEPAFLQVAVECINKQIAKAPVIRHYEKSKSFKCPTCGTDLYTILPFSITQTGISKYCPKCGQLTYHGDLSDDK